MFLNFVLSVLIFAYLHGPIDAADSPPGKWQSRAPMPSARTEVAAAETGGIIYVIGGLEKHGDRVVEYNPVNNSWRRRASLPRPLHHLGAAAANGKIYVIGGYVSGVAGRYSL
jgi:N-acetylneuraminic acid mutarotase